MMVGMMPGKKTPTNLPQTNPPLLPPMNPQLNRYMSPRMNPHMSPQTHQYMNPPQFNPALNLPTQLRNPPNRMHAIPIIASVPKLRLLSSGAQQHINVAFERNRNEDTPISALPSRSVADGLLPSPSSFYPEYGFGRSGGENTNNLLSPLSFQTPVNSNGQSFGREDEPERKRRSLEGEGQGTGMKRVKKWMLHILPLLSLACQTLSRQPYKYAGIKAIDDCRCLHMQLPGE